MAGKLLNDGSISTLGVGSIDLTNDRFFVHDASASAGVQVVAGDLLKRTLSGSDVTWMASFANIAAVDASADRFAVWDADANAWKLLAATEILDRLLTTLDISSLGSLSLVGDVDAVSDRFLVWDASASAFVVLAAGELTRRLWAGRHIANTTTPVALATTDSGFTRSNTGATIAITYTLPSASAGLRYSFVRVAPYDITLTPNGADTIAGGNSYLISAPGRVDIECYASGAWVVTSSSAASAAASAVGVYSVRSYGAVGNWSTNCSSAFAAAAAACNTKTSVILVPESTEAATPLYLLNTGNYLSSLARAGDGQPGGRTDLRGRIGLATGPLILPNGHQIIGITPTVRNDASPMSSEIWAVGGYSGTGNRLVQIGRADYLASDAHPDTTRLEKMTINGRSVASVVGCYSNSLQEGSGLSDVAIINCQDGIVFTAGANVTPANFDIRNCSIVFTTASPGNGVYAYGSNWIAQKISVVNRHTTTNADAAFVARGRNAVIRSCHFEGCDYGVDIGGPSTGVGADSGYWTRNIVVDGLTGYTLSGSGYSQPALQAMVRINNDDTYVFNVSIRNLSINAYNSAVNLVQDDVNGIVIPASSTNLELARYEFGGSIAGGDAGGSVKRPVYTSYYDRLGAPNNALMAAAVTGTTNDLATTFAAGGHAGILQITATSTPILTSMTAGITGRVVYGHNLSSVALTLDHAATTGTAANRFLCSTSADISLAAGGYFRATYGDIRGQLIDGTNYASRWYVETV